MDFRLYLRVLWRFRLLVSLGAVVALSLALLSLVRVSGDGITYRQSELWSSTTRLAVTQHGFPEGRLFAQEPTTDENAVTADEEATRLGIPIADPGRFNTLAVLYAELMSSDPVRRLMLRDGPIQGEILATPLVADKTGTMLPLIEVMAISTSPRKAVGLAMRSASALSTYVQQQQRANDVPATDRVVVEVIRSPEGAQIFQPRPKTMAIVVFFAVMFATVALAFLLENLRPRVRKPSRPVEPEAQGAEQRLTA